MLCYLYSDLATTSTTEFGQAFGLFFLWNVTDEFAAKNDPEVDVINNKACFSI